MNNKVLYLVIIVLLAVIAVGVLFLTNSNRNQPAVNQPSATPTPAAAGGAFSEQPNQAKYSEYLSDIYLGRMALGKKIGADGFPTKTNIFTAGADQFCTMMTLKKTIASGHVATAVYDVAAKQDNQPKTVFPVELKAGGSGGCGDLTQTAGRYEYKLYIDDILAAVLPFEVK